MVCGGGGEAGKQTVVTIATVKRSRDRVAHKACNGIIASADFHQWIDRRGLQIEIVQGSHA
jgi:hypothetical protein